MPVPSLITELSPTAALNSPPGGEDVHPQLDNYLRAHAAFIAQVAQAQQGVYTHKYQVACSDLSTALAINTAAAVFRSQAAFTATAVRASVKDASTSGVVTVDITVNGVTMLSTKITIDANEKSSTTAAIPAVISVPAIPDDAEVIVKIDAAGTGAKGLIVTILGI
jgi:hypothetical protein